MKFRITIFHVFDSLSSIQNCIVVIIVDKKDREKESISSSTTYVCYSFFLQVGRSYRPPEKKKRRRRRAEKLERFPSMDRWLISSILLPPVLFAAPIVAFEHVRLLTESVGPPCQRACTGSSIISAESVSSFRSAAHSTASLCPIVQLPLSESPREPLQNSLSRHRGQLIGPPAASAGTSLEHPSKSVAGARYVDLRQSPRSSRSSRIIGRKRRVSLFLRIVLVCPSSSRTPNVYFGETNSW